MVSDNKSDLDLAVELAFALQLADRADAIALPYFEKRNFTTTRKKDSTEVTQADRETETVLAEALISQRPTHGIFGEEHGAQGDPDSPWTWIIDPIDGTSNFARGVPVWATLIAIVHVYRGPVLGVVSAPALSRRWWAAEHLGAFANDRRISVSDIADIATAQVSVTFNEEWDRVGLTQELVALQQSAYRARGFGDFWQHMLVAEGAIDIAVDAIGLAPYDIAANQIIVEEAGGQLTDRFGVRDFRQNSAVSSNGLLHQRVIAALKPL
jgi:histidinol-phosphatase